MADSISLNTVKTCLCLYQDRALLLTEFYKESSGRYSTPVMRAELFKYLCENKTIHIGADELIVGERGPAPKAVSTFPELTCHAEEDLRILNNRSMTNYTISDADIKTFSRDVLPYWKGRSMRDRVFSDVPEDWRNAYEAGMFTEFMEQRAAGHTCLDGTIYRKGMLDFKKEIASSMAGLDYLNDPEATEKLETLKAMNIACDAAILFAERHADLAEQMIVDCDDPNRKAELQNIADVCRRVPAKAPRNFWEALQMYWFVHLGTITELNGWDAMNPGHLDQHLFPFYRAELASGTLDREKAKELLSCLWIKINNHPAPPKVGVTAKESGTYNDFTNINLGGLNRDGSDGVNEVSYVILEVIDGKPNTKGTTYHINMLSTTCHIYFGKMLGATPNGRYAGMPISDGTSPSHGADRNGPTAVVKSLGKMDQVKSGGTLLNQRFLPSVLEKEEDITKLMHLIRSYFKFNGHHIQFNVVDTNLLRKAQAAPDEYRNLLVRVAGYSDYFVDLDNDHQEEIIARTENCAI
jgi:pyruvate-formate lyase